MNRSLGLILLGTGVASVAALVLTSACSSRHVDLVGAGDDALERTREQASRSMTDGSEKIDRGVERFQALFDQFEPEPVSRLAREIYAPDAYFNDGFVELSGAEEIARYFARSAEHTDTIEIDLEDTVRAADGLYLRWIMDFTTSGGTRVTAPGISHLRFDAEGRIIYHRDYWDAGSALAELIPVAGSVLRAVKSRI